MKDGNMNELISELKMISDEPSYYGVLSRRTFEAISKLHHENSELKRKLNLIREISYLPADERY